MNNSITRATRRRSRFPEILGFQRTTRFPPEKLPRGEDKFQRFSSEHDRSSKHPHSWERGELFFEKKKMKKKNGSRGRGHAERTTTRSDTVPPRADVSSELIVEPVPKRVNKLPPKTNELEAPNTVLISTLEEWPDLDTEPGLTRAPAPPAILQGTHREIQAT